MVNKIIKLREAEASAATGNGQYKITLDQPITLIEGDTLAIKSAYLDTIAASGSIVELDDDTTLSMDVCRYIINDSADQVYPNPNQADRMRFYQPVPTGGDAGILNDGDGFAYFNVVVSGGNANDIKLIEVEYNVRSRAAGKMVGGFDVVFQYKGVDGSTRQSQFRIKRELATDYPKKGKSQKFEIRMDGETFAVITPLSTFKKHGIEKDSIKPVYKALVNPTADSVAELHIKNFEMTIEKGIYTPQQLGEIITDEMTRIDKSGPTGNDPAAGAHPVNNPFLGTITQTAQETGSAKAIFCKSDGTGFLSYNEATGNMITRSEDRFVGASLVELTFNEDKRKFQFATLHTPIYVNGAAGQNNGVPGLKYETHSLVNRYSGCVFTRLSSTDSQGNQTNFWDNIGFSGACVGYENLEAAIPQSGGASGAALGDVVPLRMTGAIEGKTMTAGFEGIDTPVQKNTDFRKPLTTGLVATQDMLPIEGDKVFLNNYNNEGYYFIELDMGLQQMLVGGNGSDGVGFNSNKIHGIIGTYYQNADYTSSQGEGSIVYEHKGVPQLISNIGVRILDAAGEPVDEDLLGNKNNVFLELVCPPSQM
tara:strand:+ start:628 stop:2406 length:1779 start_codon:yes stop_codon:yes gene_type:complete